MSRQWNRQHAVKNEHIETDTEDFDGPVNEEDAIIPVDGREENKFGSVQNAYEEGFGSASGVRPGTAETDGAEHSPELGDEALSPNQITNPAEEENAGLADN